MRCTRPPISILSCALLACALAPIFSPVFAAEIPDARSGGASIEWPANGALSFHDGDTLEFTLRLAPPLIENAPEDALPSVSIFLIESGAKEPAEDAAQAGRVLALRSSRPGEWIVQVRGIAPPKENVPLELLARWNFTKADGAKASGELRYPGRVAFGSKPIDIVLLMDGSWSMNESDPKRQRVAAVRDFIATARNSAAIGRIGIVQFDSKSVTLIPLTPVTGNFENAINAISAVGLTDIEGGIRHSLNAIEPDRRNGAAIVLFTDGNQEPGEYLNAHFEAQKAGVAIHTMTLGRDADRKLLKRIAEETGGSYADAEKDNDISAAYAAIVSRITRLRTISTTELNDANKIMRVPVDPTCSALYLATVSEKPGVLKLQLPDGKNWASGEATNPQNFTEKPTHGEWSAQWERKQDAPGAPPAVRFAASARTPLYPLFFRASPLPAAPVEFDANDPRLAVSLYDGATAVADARIEAHFEYVITVNDEYKTERATIALLNDGKHGDGVYAAEIESLDFLSKTMDFNKGTLSIVVTGTRQGQPFRRELQSPFLLKRAAPPALLVNGAYDLGEKFAGETTVGEVHLRVRGSGGAFKTALESTPEKLAQNVHLIEPPAALRAKEKRTQQLEIQLPDLLPPGEYSGVARFELAGVESVKIPWRVKVLPVVFKVEPPRLELGSAFPGATIKAKLKLATNGGAISLKSVSSPLQKNPPFTALTLDKTEHEIELEFSIPESAAAGDLSHELIFTDAANRERGRVPVSLRVTPVKLNVYTHLDFGTVESGDALKRDIVLKWEGTAPIPIVPRIALSPSAFKPELSPLSARDGGWATSFTLTLPADAPSGDAAGIINIEAGPFKSKVLWSAKIIKPGVTSDLAALDFGRVYPSRHAERKIVLRADSARPIEVELSVAKPFAKPRVAGIALPESALTFSSKIVIAAGGSATIPFTLTIPDDAQDGRYETVLRVVSRVGQIEIPLSVKAVNVVDAAAFHVTPTSMLFKITEGELLPFETLHIVSHDDEPLHIILSVPAFPAVPPNAETNRGDPTVPPAPPPAPAPLAFLFSDAKQELPLSTLNLTLPARGAVSVTVRPRPDARDTETGSIHIDGGGEHQEVDLRAQRFVTQALAPVQPEPPKLLNWIIAFIVLLLILAAVLAKFFIKKSGVRYVCYAAIVHLIIFSLAMPQKAILEALPESIEVSLLDAQESLGMSLSDQQSRRLDALHAGGGAGDDKRAPVLAQAALPAKEGPVELPTPGAGPASPRPGLMNLDAARGVERPVRPADVPEPARGSPNAPVLNDAPLAFDADKPVVKEKPAAAEKVSADTPRVIEASSIQSTPEPIAIPTNFATAAPVSKSAPATQALARNTASINMERPPEAPRKSVETVEPGRRSAPASEDAPLNVASDAPLAFDNAPVAAPQVKPNPKVPEIDVARNIPVSALESGLGAPGLGTLNAPLTPLALSAPGTPGSLDAGPGDSRVALARTSALPTADSSAGVGSGINGALIGNSTSDANAGVGFGRVGGGLPSGGEEPLAIGTDGGDGPGAKAAGVTGDGLGGGRGSGNGNSLIGGTQTGSGKNGSGGKGGDGGFGGTGRTTAAGGGGLGGDGIGFVTGGSGNGTSDFGLPNGNGNEWHGRPGGKGGGNSLSPGLSSSQLEGIGGNGTGGTGGGGNGNGAAGGGLKIGNGIGNGNGNGTGVGGIPNGTGFGPAGRLPGGFGLNGDGPGGMGDKPLAIGPTGGGGIKPAGTGIASGGGDLNGLGGGGGYGIGRTGAAGGTALDGGGGPGGLGLGGIGGSGIAGGNGRPGGANDKRISLARGMGSKDLEDGGGVKSKAVGVIPGPPHRGISSPFTGGLIRIALGLAKHSGDWNSSPTALQHLRSAFIERSGLPELEVTVPTVEVSDLNAMLKCRTIMFTSNFPVVFKPAEIDALREYIARGGTLWVNDSSASDYEKFDEAFRPQVPLLVPGAQLVRLPVEHDFFLSCYDLSKGFKGFRIPPGDKYRQDYMEAAFMPDPKKPTAAPKKPAANGADAEVVDLADGTPLIHRRAGIIYTRNDYSDGLEIDPRMNAGMKSLTDLTNGEMLESSLRFGMNLVAYSMGPQGLKLPPPPETVAEFEKIYRYKGPALPVLDDFSVLLDQWTKPTWAAEKDWCNETLLAFDNNKVEKATIARVTCKAGEKFKAAITRYGLRDLSQTRALVLDLHSSLAQGLNVSLMFHAKDDKVYESRAVFVRPGWNRNLRFPLEMGDMKSSAGPTPWKSYDTPFEPRNAVDRISVLIYNLNESGTVLVGPIREQK